MLHNLMSSAWFFFFFLIFPILWFFLIKLLFKSFFLHIFIWKLIHCWINLLLWKCTESKEIFSRLKTNNPLWANKYDINAHTYSHTHTQKKKRKSKEGRKSEHGMHSVLFRPLKGFLRKQKKMIFLLKNFEWNFV